MITAIYSVFHIRFIDSLVLIPYFRTSLLGRETEAVGRKILDNLFIDCRIVIDIRFFDHIEFLIPTLELEVLAISWRFAPIFRCFSTIDGVTLQLRSVWVLEDDDWGGLDLEQIRHLGDAMLVISAAARENEETLFIYAIHPIFCRIHLIIQREDTHLYEGQVDTIFEHFIIALIHQLVGRQHWCLNKFATSIEHSIIAPDSQLGSWQFRRIG